MKEPWEVIFERLKSFKEKFGHCNVPAHRDKLGRWVERQRTQYRLGKLRPERIEALESVGFYWKLQEQVKPVHTRKRKGCEDSFYEMVNRVVVYVEQNGHGWIPENYKHDTELGIWSKNRRREKKLGILEKDRVESLEKAGFIWEFKNRWNHHEKKQDG